MQRLGELLTAERSTLLDIKARNVVEDGRSSGFVMHAASLAALPITKAPKDRTCDSLKGL